MLFNPFKVTAIPQVIPLYVTWESNECGDTKSMHVGKGRWIRQGLGLDWTKIYTRSSDKINTSVSDLIRKVPYYLSWEELFLNISSFKLF